MTTAVRSSFARLLESFDARGRDFELLCRWFLTHDPEYAAEFETVWLWRDWPGRWGPDKGIDLVAVTRTGRVIAIQAKCYGESHSISKRDVDTFLSESNRPGIDERLLIATTNRVAASARDVMANQDKPVSLCLRERLDASAVDWPATLAATAAAVVEPFSPRDYQREALDTVARWAESEDDRGQVIMACGTGKSLIAAWAADEMQADSVLVLVPTLRLLRQTAGVWAMHAATQRDVLRVCSDQSRTEDETLLTSSDLGLSATTEPENIASFLAGAGRKVVFCTYDSSPAVAAAMQQAPQTGFDLVIADEAHRCSGLETSRHKTVLDATAIRAKRRLFFTATPTVFGVRDKARAKNINVRLASMDDTGLFGRVIHRLSFAEAIRRELLCPYQVAVMPIHDDEVGRMIDERRLVTTDGEYILDAPTLAAQIACGRAMRRFDCRRIVAFHPSIKDSKRFAGHFPRACELLSETERLEASPWSEHIDGAQMPQARRHQILRAFEADGDDRRLLSNVKLLTEGVDVPGIDAVVFVDTRRGQASIIQAVGRAVRPAPGKTVGTILLPIVVKDDETVEAALSRSEHRGIVNVLGALRSHDPDIERSLDQLRFTSGPDDVRSTLPGRFVIDAPTEVGDEFADAVDLALTKALGTTVSRAPKRRAAAIPTVVIESEPPSDEEVFAGGFARFEEMAPWGLPFPTLPIDPTGFPLSAWFEEVKRRWRSSELAVDHKDAIAESLSWLAPHLGGPRSALRSDIADRTSHDVPEQLTVQVARGGIYAGPPLSALAGDSPREVWELDELLRHVRATHRCTTHAAMSPFAQATATLAALRPLAQAIIEHTDESWYDDRDIIMSGFSDRLAAIAAEHRGDPAPARHWSYWKSPTRYDIGAVAAEPLQAWVRRIASYRFPDDLLEVAERQRDETSLPADQRLDALGWEIYLLFRARGGSSQAALGQAMSGNYAARRRVRTDLLKRAGN